MSTSDPRWWWRSLRTAGHVALLTLVALTLAVEGGQPVHTHDASAAALFNGDCPLAAVAAFHGASLLPSSPPSAWMALTGAVALAQSFEQLPQSPVQHAASRAPPALLA